MPPSCTNSDQSILSIMMTKCKNKYTQTFDHTRRQTYIAPIIEDQAKDAPKETPASKSGKLVALKTFTDQKHGSRDDELFGGMFEPSDHITSTSKSGLEVSPI